MGIGIGVPEKMWYTYKKRGLSSSKEEWVCVVSRNISGTGNQANWIAAKRFAYTKNVDEKPR
jgi:hypothetical protein